MKGVLKVSKEQVIEIERYCDEHGNTQKRRIYVYRDVCPRLLLNGSSSFFSFWCADYESADAVCRHVSFDKEFRLFATHAVVVIFGIVPVLLATIPPRVPLVVVVEILPVL